MVTYKLHFLDKDKDTFNKIKNKEKNIETRALNPKGSEFYYYAEISSGDFILFDCANEKFRRKVKSVRKYTDINEYLENEDIGAIMGKKVSKDEALKIYNSFPGYEERIKKYGIVVYELG